MKTRILFGLALALILMLIVINACKGDSDSGSDDPVDSSPKKATGLVELGTVVGASVRIETRQGAFLFEAQTNREGKYQIDLDEIKEKIKEIEDQKGSAVNYVHIVTTGGTDMDPNDDGVAEEGESKKVLGSVSAIVPVTALKENERINANLLTTYIDEMLVDVETIDENLLNEAAERLQVGDANQDGTIDYRDAIQYKMTENESIAESELRARVLEHIHKGEKDKIKETVREERRRKNFLRINSLKQGNKLRVWIKGIGKGRTVRYAIDRIESEQLANNYNRESFLLGKNSFLGYKECFSDGTCSEPFVHYFDGQNSYGYFPEYMMESKEELERKLRTAREKKDKAKARGQKLAAEIKKLKEELAMLNSIGL